MIEISFAKDKVRVRVTVSKLIKTSLLALQSTNDHNS